MTPQEERSVLIYLIETANSRRHRPESEVIAAMQGTLQRTGTMLVDRTAYRTLVLDAEAKDGAMATIGIAIGGIAGCVVGVVASMLIT